MIPEINGDFLQQLRGFYYVALHGSVSGAGEHMKRNQSTITYQIQSLERELDVVLFLRLKNRMVLTDDGKKLLEWSMRVFDTVSGLQEDLQGYEKKGICRIAGNRPLFQSQEFASCFQDFHQCWPNIHVSLNSIYPNMLYESIKNGQNDFGIVANSSRLEYLEFTSLFMSPFLLIMSKCVPYKFSYPITLDDLKSLPYISFSMNKRGESIKENFIPQELQKYMDENSVLSCNSYLVIIKYVAMGLGCTIIDTFSWKSFEESTRNTIKVISLDGVVEPLQYSIIFRKKCILSKVQKSFVDIVRRKMENLDLRGYTARFIRRE